MKKFEYKVAHGTAEYYQNGLGFSLQDQLNTYGLNGWELVNISLTAIVNKNHDFTAVFKKEIEKKSQ
jgi:hypothetical protein